MPLFQYQQKAEPLLPIAPPPPPPAVPLSWAAHYPDTVPHRRTRRDPSLFFVEIPTVFSTTEVRVSQASVELPLAYGQPLVRVSQAAVEVVHQYATPIRQVRLSQIVVEIIYPFGCFTFVPPLPSACAVSLVPLVPLSSVPACPIPNGIVEPPFDPSGGTGG